MTLPAGWRFLTPHELAGEEKTRLIIGPFGSNLKTTDYRSDGVPLVFVKDIRQGSFRTPRQFVDRAKSDELRSHVAIPGDVLITKMGEPPGDAAVYTGTQPAVITADCIRLRPIDDFDPRFIALAMQAPVVKRQVELITSGIAQRKVSLARFRSGLSIPVPPLEEQRRIVDTLEDHLSRLDAATAYLATAGCRLGAMTTAVLRDAIPDVTSYPATWERSTTAGAGTVELGRQRHPDWHTGPNMRPYLRVANVFEDRIDTSDVMQMHWPAGVFERFQLHDGDVLLNEGQSPDYLGRPAIYRGEPADTAFTNSLIRFRASGRVLPEFALLVFRRHMRSGRFKQESRITTNIAHLSAARLKSIEFPVPPLEEQIGIVSAVRDQLAAIDRMRVEVRQAASHAPALRRSLLAAAFSGRLTGGSLDNSGGVAG